jgi:hypothetical protein
MMLHCQQCEKVIGHEDTYRCRICKEPYCGDCSLGHFGLYEKDNKVKYKSFIKAIFWIIKKQIGHE